MNQFYKNLALWLVISLVMILLFNMMTQKEHEQKPISYTTFLSAVEKGKVAAAKYCSGVNDSQPT